MSFSFAKYQAVGSSEKDAAEAIVSFLAEQIPELARFDTTETIKTGTTSTSYTYYDTCKWCEFAGMGFGFMIRARRTVNYSNDYWGVAITSCAIADGGGTPAQEYYDSVSIKSRTVSGVVEYYIDCCVVKVESGYIIRLDTKGYYLGCLTSAIAGKVLIFSELSHICYHSKSLPSDYDRYSRVWVESQGVYTMAYVGCIAPCIVSRPDNTVILCPIYISLSSICAEPLVLPGVYRFYSSAIPGYDDVVDAAGVEVMQVDATPVVVARAKT